MLLDENYGSEVSINYMEPSRAVAENCGTKVTWIYVKLHPETLFLRNDAIWGLAENHGYKCQVTVAAG